MRPSIRVPRSEGFQLGTKEYLGPGQSRKPTDSAHDDPILDDLFDPDDAYSYKQ
jgi:hypothetical protein